MSDQTRFMLGENDIPRFWYNVNADNPVPPQPVLVSDPVNKPEYGL